MSAPRPPDGFARRTPAWQRADEPGDPTPAAGALSQYLLGDATLLETLERVCAAAVEAVTPAWWAGISMTIDAQLGTWVCTEPMVATVDRAQYDSGEGPCVDAYRAGLPTGLRTTAPGGPYPAFAAAAAKHGIGSVLSMPMHANGVVIGALNFYAVVGDAFRSIDIDQGALFAVQAAVLIANARAYWDVRSLSENLTEAMQSRATIEQAKGVLMAKTRCTEEEAFDLMRRQSQHENIKLREVAEEIVARAQR